MGLRSEGKRGDNFSSSGIDDVMNGKTITSLIIFAFALGIFIGEYIFKEECANVEDLKAENKVLMDDIIRLDAEYTSIISSLEMERDTIFLYREKIINKKHDEKEYIIWSADADSTFRIFTRAVDSIR